MIVRVLGEGQYDVDPSQLDRLNELDDRLAAAIEAGDEAGFAVALDRLLARVRQVGTTVADDVLTVSDLVLPAADASLAEVGAILGDEGLIPD